MTVRHIPLARRKALCSRLVFLESEPKLLGIADAGGEALVNRLRTDVFARATETMETSEADPTTDVALDRSVTELFDHVVGEYTGTRTSRPHVLLQPVLRDLRERANSISCARCHPGPRCDGGPADDDIVAAGGQCIEPLKRMFDVAKRATQASYQKFATQLPHPLPEIRLSTGFMSRKPHDIDVPYFVGGTTDYAADGAAEVLLSFWIERFDWDTYLGTLYVLFHELVSHGYSGLLPSAEGRTACEPSDRFAEGWMDQVAFMVMRDVLEGASTPAQLGVSIGSASEFVATGTTFHHRRGDWRGEQGKRPVEATQLAKGRDVADKVFSLLKRLPDSAGDPKAAFYSLSFDLNLALRTKVDRVRFVTAADNLPEPGKPEEAEPLASIRISGLIHKYLKDKDVMTLIAKALRRQ